MWIEWVVRGKIERQPRQTVSRMVAARMKLKGPFTATCRLSLWGIASCLWYCRFGCTVLYCITRRLISINWLSTAICYADVLVEPIPSWAKSRAIEFPLYIDGDMVTATQERRATQKDERHRTTKHKAGHHNILEFSELAVQYLETPNYCCTWCIASSLQKGESIWHFDMDTLKYCGSGVLFSFCILRSNLCVIT